MCADPGPRPLGPALAWALPAALAARLWAGLRQPAGVGPLSPAELKLLDPRAWDPPQTLPDLAQVGALVADHANMHHGGYLAVQLLCWAVDGALTAAGLELPLVSLRLSGLLLGLGVTAAWAWAAAGLRLSPALAGLCLALPPLWATQGWSLAYGSHAEVGALVGVLVGARARGRAGLAVAAAGAAAGFDPLVAPALLLCAPLWWPWGASARGALLALAAAAPFTLPRLLAAGARLWTLGVAEGPHTRPAALLIGALDPFQLGAALRGLQSLSLLPPGAYGGHGAAISGLLVGALLLLGLGAGAGRGPQGRAARLVQLLPLLHLGALTLLSPLRPGLQHRYLLPALGAALLWPALAARRGGLRAGLAGAVVIGMSVLQADLLLALPASGPPAARAAYAGAGGAPGWPWAAQRAGLEQLDPAGAPAWAALAACRAGPRPDRALAVLDADPMWRGAAMAAAPRAGTARLGEPGRPPQPALELPARLAGAEPAVAFGAGVGLAALEPRADDGVRRAVQRAPGALRPAVEAGLAWGRAAIAGPVACPPAPGAGPPAATVGPPPERP